jgi:hypothetical protein
MIFRHFRFDLHALKDICPERDGENVCPACPKVHIVICIGNYTVREVLMKNSTRVWRNIYNTASA